MRVLAFGAGVIGSAYAGRLLQVGNEVTLLARNARLAVLRAEGLMLEEPLVETRTRLDVRATDVLSLTDTFDLVVVAVRAKQLLDTLPLLVGMTDSSDVLFLGDLAPFRSQLADILGPRAMFGFPSISGVQEGSTTRYAQIGRHKTVLSEPNGAMTARIRQIQTELSIAGFPTIISANIHDWMLAHDAFVVPIACALQRAGGDPERLSADTGTLRLMVAAIREAFTGLRSHGDTEIPENLQITYRHVPTLVLLAHWRRVLRDQRGELWFGAHARSTADELHLRVSELRAALGTRSHETPALDQLVFTVRP